MYKLYLTSYRQAVSLSDWLLRKGHASFVRRDDTFAQGGGKLLMSKTPTLKAIDACKKAGVKYWLKL